jgi:hypothetical protein
VSGVYVTISAITLISGSTNTPLLGSYRQNIKLSNSSSQLSNQINGTMTTTGPPNYFQIMTGDIFRITFTFNDGTIGNNPPLSSVYLYFQDSNAYSNFVLSAEAIVTGPQGVPGQTGLQGATGLRGATGPQGTNFWSATTSGSTGIFYSSGGVAIGQTSITSGYVLDVNGRSEMSITSNGESSISSLDIVDTTSSNRMSFFPNATSTGGTRNFIIQDGDQCIVAGSPDFNTEILTLCSHSSITSGVRIAPTSVTIGAGGSSSTPISYVTCNGSNVEVGSNIFVRADGQSITMVGDHSYIAGQDSSVGTRDFYIGTPNKGNKSLNIVNEKNGEILLKSGTDSSTSTFRGRNKINTYSNGILIHRGGNVTNPDVYGGEIGLAGNDTDNTFYISSNQSNAININSGTGSIIMDTRNRIVTYSTGIQFNRRETSASSVTYGGEIGLTNTSNNHLHIIAPNPIFIASTSNNVTNSMTITSSTVIISTSNVINVTNVVPDSSLDILDNITTNRIRFFPNSQNIAFNHIMSQGDQSIIAANTGEIIDTETLTLTTHSSYCSGVKITASSVIMGAGGTSNTPTHRVTCDTGAVNIFGTLHLQTGNVQISTSGNMTIGTIIATGNIRSGTSGTVGYIVLNEGYDWGGSSNTGYLAFFTKNGTRLGYLGHISTTDVNNPTTSNTGQMSFVAESGCSGFHFLAGSGALANMRVDGSLSINGTEVITSGRNIQNVGSISASSLSLTSGAYINTDGNMYIGSIDFTGNITATNTQSGAGNITVNGFIRPSSGSGDNGIIFPLDPGSGSGDVAYIKYYARSGEACNLEIGIQNDGHDHIFLNPSGNVGIKTNNPSFTLDVTGTINATSDLYVNGDIIKNGTNKWIIHTPDDGRTDLIIAPWNYSNSSWNWSEATSINSNGNMTVSGSVTATLFTQSSDYRVKKDIKPLDLEEYSVDNLNPVHFKYKDSGQESIGLIAHELQKEYPFLVEGEKDGKETQSVNYNGLIGVLIKEIQELKNRIKILENKIEII